MTKLILFFELYGTNIFISCFIIEFHVYFVQDVSSYFVSEKLS